LAKVLFPPSSPAQHRPILDDLVNELFNFFAFFVCSRKAGLAKEEGLIGSLHVLELYS
jgi:hypothetical protein